MPTVSASRTAAIVLTITAALSAAPARSADLNQPVAFDIPAQPLNSALLAFSKQAKIQVVVAPNATTGLSAPAVHATMAADVALNELLRASGLQYHEVNGTVTIAPVSGAKTSDASALRLADGGPAVASDTSSTQIPVSEAENPASPEQSSERAKESALHRRPLDEVVVTGTQIRGIKPDSSPLTVIDRGEIERSGVATVGELLQKIPQILRRLTQVHKSGTSVVFRKQQTTSWAPE